MPDVGGIAGDRLKSFIERIERLEEERAEIAGYIKEVYADAKGAGFDTKIVRLLIKERRMDKDDLDEQQTLLDVYKRALGMLVDTPLGEAALDQVTAATARPRSAKARRAAKEFVGAVPKNPGDSVSLTGPDGTGVSIKNIDGKKVVEAIGGGS